MNLESITLREIDQTEKDKYHMASLLQDGAKVGLQLFVWKNNTITNK